jgi:signal transduction histidine kinase
MPAGAAQPLQARGIVMVAGHPIRSGDRVVGALHLYFDEFKQIDLAPVTQALRVTAAFATNIYTGREATPVRSQDEEDDRSLFLAVAGHELRTPVTVVKGYASLLADRWESLDDEQRRSATKALTQRAHELARLVDRLLGATAGEAATVRTIPFDPVDAIRRAAEELSDELRRAVRVALPNSLPPASGDPDVVGTVVTELVTNAVRAKSSTVDLTAGADADTVYFQVLDRGVGIDPAQAERAFERFWREPRAPSGENGRDGIGLGLYLVRRLVERQNGWVSLRPRDGGGTIAEVRLARADGQARSATGEA